MNLCETVFSEASIPQGARIAIWGAGGFGQDVLDFLAESRSDIEVLFFLDSYAAGTVRGFEVHTPDILDEKADAIDAILLASTHHKAIASSLTEESRAMSLIVGQSMLDAWRHARGQKTRFNLFSIELSRSCDMECDFCNHQVLKDTKGIMPFHHYSELVRQISEEKWADSLCFAGVGEPLCHPQVMEAVTIGTQAGLSMEICSNGLLLTPGKIVELHEAGLKTLSLSVHTLSPTSFAHRRPKNGKSFEDWYGNLLACFREHVSRDMDMQVCIRLMYAFPEWDSTRIWGLKGIEQDADSAFDLGMKLMNDLRDMALDAGKEFSGSTESFRAALQELRETQCDQTLDDIMSNFQFNMTALHLSRPAEMLDLAQGNLSDYELVFPEPMRCTATVPLVTYNGDVFPCCTLTKAESDYGQLKLGNCFDESLASCFASEKFQRFDAKNRMGELNWGACRNCKSSYVYK